MDIRLIFSLMGGLGLFLFGMKLMSEGLEKAAGSRMRSILEFFTQNRFFGMVVGLVFTAIIQSSNATTVMVVSFVNSGLMTLMQATGVILGANIGTTVTGQLIAFNLSDIAPVIVMLGVIMVMFCKDQKITRWGDVVLGFGVLFFGLSVMSERLGTLRESPYVMDFLGSLTNPLAAILVGFIITAILQSSSATVGIIIVMASQELLAFTICPFLILGCNIGSCVSALLASLSGRKDAKRAALIHFLFNVVGSFIMFLILSFALEPITNALLYISGGSVARAVANAHTSIKVFEVLIMFPFMGWVVKATYKLVPGKDPSPKDGYELLYIGRNNLLSPATAFLSGLREIEHMGRVAITNVREAMEVLYEPDVERISKVYETEKYIDFMNQEITNYLVKVNEMELPHEDALLMGGLFHVVNDIERIGDHAENFADSAKRRIEQGVDFSEKGKKQLKDMAEKVFEILEYSLEMFSHRNPAHMQDVLRLEDEIDEDERRLRRFHVKRLAKNKCTPEAGVMFSDTISGLERVSDHATNIAFAITEPYDEADEEEEE